MKTLDIHESHYRAENQAFIGQECIMSLNYKVMAHSRICLSEYINICKKRVS